MGASRAAASRALARRGCGVHGAGCLHHVPGGARLSRDYWLEEMEFTFLIKKDCRVCR
jgi:hypothetical protein